MKLTFDVEDTAYNIALPSDFDVIDFESVNTGLSNFNLPSITVKISKLDGVFDVDHNGHFGNKIYVKITKEHDNAATKKAIRELIKEAENLFIKGTPHSTYKYMVLVDTLFLETANDQAATIYALKGFCNEHGGDLVDYDNNVVTFCSRGSACHYYFTTHEGIVKGLPHLNLFHVQEK